MDTKTRPAVALHPQTHDQLLALAKKWRQSPALGRITVTHDMLVRAGLTLLDRELDWEALAKMIGPDTADTFAAIATALELTAAGAEDLQ